VTTPSNGHGPVPGNGGSSAASPAPYRKGWRAPWAGTWGPLSDGNSRLARLAARIARELAPDYDLTKPAWARRVREAAELKALAQAARAQLGVNPKVTLRQITAATMAAERLLASVARNGGKRREVPLDLARELAERGRGA